jgi:hypothetical protein
MDEKLSSVIIQGSNDVSIIDNTEGGLRIRVIGSQSVSSKESAEFIVKSWNNYDDNVALLLRWAKAYQSLIDALPADRRPHEIKDRLLYVYKDTAKALEAQKAVS